MTPSIVYTDKGFEVSVSGRKVLAGEISLNDWNPFYPAPAGVPTVRVGPATKSGMVIADDGATLKVEHLSARAAVELSSWNPWAETRDIHIRAVIENRSTTLPLWPVSLRLPVPTLSIAGGSIDTADLGGLGTVNPMGWLKAAPCPEQPLPGAWWVREAGNGVGIGWSVLGLEEGDRVLLNAPEIAKLRATGTCGQLHLWLDKAIEPGQSRTVQIVVRVSAALDQNDPAAAAAFLVRPWIDDQKARRGRPLYVGDVSPMAFGFISDASQVTGANPLGYKPGCRLDSSNAGDDLWLFNTVTGLKGWRTILWSPPGHRPPMMRPEIFGPHPTVAAKLHDMAIDARAARVRLGFGCRPGVEIVPGAPALPWAQGGTTVEGERLFISPAAIVAEVDKANAVGATGHYLDSLGQVNGNVSGCLALGVGQYPTALQIARAVRDRLLRGDDAGPGLIEMADLWLSRYGGVYLACRWDAGRKGFRFGGPEGGMHDETTWRILRAVDPYIFGAAQLFVPDDQVRNAIDWCLAPERCVLPAIRLDQLAAHRGYLEQAVAARRGADGWWK
jgi:hypothetical protein